MALYVYHICMLKDCPPYIIFLNLAHIYNNSVTKLCVLVIVQCSDWVDGKVSVEYVSKFFFRTVVSGNMQVKPIESSE